MAASLAGWFMTFWIVGQITSVIWVYIDATTIRNHAQKKMPGWIPIDATKWTVMCFLFWGVALPLYLFKRVEILAEVQRQIDIYDNLPEKYKYPVK